MIRRARRVGVGRPLAKLDRLSRIALSADVMLYGHPQQAEEDGICQNHRNAVTKPHRAKAQMEKNHRTQESCNRGYYHDQEHPESGTAHSLHRMKLRRSVAPCSLPVRTPSFHPRISSKGIESSALPRCMNPSHYLTPHYLCINDS